MRRHMTLVPMLVLAAATCVAAQQAPPAAPPAAAPAAAPQQGAPAPDAASGARARMSRQVAPGPDDKPAYAEPPASAFERRDGIAHGKLELVEYDSKTVGTRRKLNVYTPPGYSTDKKYPVAYLLHGIGGDEGEWIKFATPDALFDNLIADGKMVPFVAVFPNGRAQKNDRAEGNVFASAPAFAVFERDLIDDVIPFIEGRYSVKADRESRALAGLSMGGGQTLNFGFANLDRFAWLGAFSPAPNSKAPEQLVPDPAAAKKQLKLFMLTCGSKDGLLDITHRTHEHLKKHDVPHVYHVDTHAHDPPHWRAALHAFAQRIFR
jgi:enterochelin esterase-like enzyme